MHSEYSVTDGIVRIDEAVAQAKADGMPALALTDGGNVFGMVKFYTAARAAGIKPVIGVDCWIQNDSDREKPYRALLLCASRAGYLRLSELLSRAWLKNQHRARAEIAMDWFRERRHRGPDRAVGLRRRRRRARAGGRQRGGGREAGRGLGEALSRALLPRSAARGRAQHREAGRRHARARGAACKPAGGGDAPGAVHRARGLQGARGARLHLAGLRARRPAPAEAVHARAVLQDAGRDGAAVRRPAAGAGERGRDRAPLQPRDRARQEPAAGVPDAEGGFARCVPEERSREGPGAQDREAEAQGRGDAALPRAPRVRDQDHRADGLRGLLPHRRRLHQLGEVERRAGGPGARLGRGLAGGLRARHHRPRSAQVRPAVRALPQSRSACRCPTSTSTSARTAATA